MLEKEESGEGADGDSGDMTTKDNVSPQGQWGFLEENRPYAVLGQIRGHLGNAPPFLTDSDLVCLSEAPSEPCEGKSLMLCLTL